jgi:hypothetical protein
VLQTGEGFDLPCLCNNENRTVELVDKGPRGGKVADFSTASGPVRRRRIAHKSTVPNARFLKFLSKIT